VIALGLLVVALQAGRARAEDAPVDYRQKAMTEFGLGQFAEAAQCFERAYAQTPEPALLYNAAQSYRLAGNKPRALLLYKNYRRLFGDKDRPDVASRIEELEKAIAAEQPAHVEAGPPPAAAVPAVPVPAPPPAVSPVRAEPVPAPVPGPAALPAAPPLAADSSAPVLVARPEAGADDRSIFAKPWFWVVVGGVVAAGVVGVVLATGGTKDPAASIGRVQGD
jgi:tetratricopeptide (TPR) repeat protein